MTSLFLINTWWLQNNGTYELGLANEDINWSVNREERGAHVTIVAMGDGANITHQSYEGRADPALFINIFKTSRYNTPPEAINLSFSYNISQSSLALAAGSQYMAGFAGVAPDATVGAYYFFDNSTEAESLQYVACYDSKKWDIALLSYQYDLCLGSRFCIYPEPDSLKEDMIAKCLYNPTNGNKPKPIVVPVEHNQASDVLFTPPARWPLIFTIAGVNNRGLPLDHGSEGAGIFMACPVADRAAIPGATVSPDYTMSNFTTPNASAAIFAGGLAVLLGINKDFTIPDLMFITALTADVVQPDSLLWDKNGFGLNFNRRVGFGRLNLGKAVERAKKWESLGRFKFMEKSINVDVDKEAHKMDEAEEYTFDFSDASEDATVLFAEVKLSGAQLSFGSLNPHLVSPTGTDCELKILSESDRSLKIKNVQLPAYKFLGDSLKGNWTLSFYKIDDAYRGLVTQITVKIYYVSKKVPKEYIDQSPKSNPFSRIPNDNKFSFNGEIPPMVAASNWTVNITNNCPHSKYMLMYLENKKGTQRTKVKGVVIDGSSIFLPYVPSVFKDGIEINFTVESLDSSCAFTASTGVEYVNKYKPGIILFEAAKDEHCQATGSISNTSISNVTISFDYPCIVAYYALNLSNVTDDGYSSSITQSIITSENKVILNRVFNRNLGQVIWKSIVPSNRNFKFQLSPTSSGRTEQFDPLTVSVYVKEQTGIYVFFESQLKELWILIFIIVLFAIGLAFVIKNFWQKGIHLDGDIHHRLDDTGALL